MIKFDQTYLEIRSRICDTFLIWFSILTVPALILSLYRAVDIGWQSVMTLQIFLATGIWLTTLYRKRLPYQFRTGFILSLMCIVGFTGVWTFGLVAGSIAWLVITPVLGTVFYGVRSGLAILAGIILMTSANGFVIVTGLRSPTFDLVTYATSVSSWINLELAWVMTSGGMVITIGLLNKFFVESLEISGRQEGELKEGEREYRNILDNMVDAFYRADQEGRIVMMSPSVVDAGGYVPEELIGKQLTEYYVDKGMRDVFLKRLQKGGGKVSDFETEIHKKGGGTVWVSTSARYWKDAEGNTLGVEGTIRNITEHKTGEEALRRAQKMEAVGQLSGGIAHDYNNMLGVIIGNIQLVQGASELDDKSRQWLGKAFAAAQRNAELTNKLLGFSRSNSGGTLLTAANDLIANLEEIIIKSLTASIRVEIDLADNLWLVAVDPADLEDMILNLVINARDAMPTGGVLAIGSSNKVFDDDFARHNPGSTAGDYVMIYLSDTGTGMSKEIREKIFDPFFTTKETGKGTGLGLSMVYAFVQRSGGFIKVYSEPGEGTSFGIFLPRAQGGASEETASEEIADLQPSGGSEKVLIVDDEAFLVDLAVSCLEGLGYSTFSACDGKQAMEVLKANQDIDLLFSDVIMPGDLDGYDLALAAIKARPSLKVQLTSGFARKREELVNSEDETVSRLTSNLLSKPYTLSELARAVRRTLDEKV